MRLWKLARMRMTRRFILLHNLVILAFERALLGLEYSAAFRMGNAGGLSTSWLGLSPKVQRSEPKPAKDH